MLPELPDHLFFSLCTRYGLSASDLAALEGVCRHFRLPRADLRRREAKAPLTEAAVEALLAAREDGWRVVARPGECQKYVLFLHEARLWPLAALAAGSAHSLAVTDGGQVVSFGSNHSRQLGTPSATSAGSTLSRAEPRPVPKLRGRGVSVAAGRRHSAALTADGGLLTWGDARTAALGIGRCTTGPRAVVYVVSPRLITGDPAAGAGARVRVALVSAGHSHTAILTASGNAWSWGLGAGGRLGHGDENDRHVPCRVAALADGARCVGLDCGAQATAVVTVAGELLLCGSTLDNDSTVAEPGDWGAIALPIGAPPVRRVSLGHFHAAALDDEGTVYTWGSGGQGVLGHGDRTPRTTPTAVKCKCILAPVVQVCCGGAHTLAVTADGELWAWGNNSRGQLGIDKLVANRSQPSLVSSTKGLMAAAAVCEVSCGNEHTLVRYATGEVASFGANAYGQLGPASPEELEFSTDKLAMGGGATTTTKRASQRRVSKAPPPARRQKPMCIDGLRCVVPVPRMPAEDH
jgi:alpha-tubulin suppressor-like RCC1 family protein